MNKDIDSLRAAYNAWAAAADFRTGRDRNKRFTYGDQWSDYVDDHNGGKMREFDLALHRGQRPLTNNLIRQLVKAIVGRYRNMAAEQKFYDMTEGSDADRNRLPDLDARMLEEFVISGCAVQRVVNECRVGGAGVWVDNVDCRRFFVNRFADPRGTDISLIGMMHDMSLPEIINRFGGGSLPKARELTRIFDGTSSDDAVRFMASEALGTASGVSMPFFTAAAGRCRVIELWTLDSRPVTTARCSTWRRRLTVTARIRSW